MNEASGARVQALVVGAGPVGLALALRLAQQGVAVRVVERQPSHIARLHPVLIHARAQSVLQELGVWQGALSRAHSIQRCRVYLGATCRAVLELPRPVWTLRQDVLRQALVRALQARGVEVEWSSEVTLVKQLERTVTVRLLRRDLLKAMLHIEQGTPGQLEILEADYVLGADGYDSSVRHWLGAESLVCGPLESYLFFDAQQVGDPNADVQLGCADGLSGAVYPVAGGRVRFAAQIASGLHQLPVLEELRQFALARWPWHQGEIVTSEWSGLAEFRHYVVDRFGRGRVWLAGDAAHGTGPLGVHSLNVGVVEAHELGSLVAAACRGQATDFERGYGLRRRAEWDELLGGNRGVLSRQLPGWAREQWPSLVESLPASGADLLGLLGQLRWIDERDAAQAMRARATAAVDAGKRS